MVVIEEYVLGNMLNYMKNKKSEVDSMNIKEVLKEENIDKEYKFGGAYL